MLRRAARIKRLQPEPGAAPRGVKIFRYMGTTGHLLNWCKRARAASLATPPGQRTRGPPSSPSCRNHIRSPGLCLNTQARRGEAQRGKAYPWDRGSTSRRHMRLGATPSKRQPSGTARSLPSGPPFVGQMGCGKQRASAIRPETWQAKAITSSRVENPDEHGGANATTHVRSSSRVPAPGKQRFQRSFHQPEKHGGTRNSRDIVQPVVH